MADEAKRQRITGVQVLAIMESGERRYIALTPKHGQIILDLLSMKETGNVPIDTKTFDQRQAEDRSKIIVPDKTLKIS